jgi:hypothetical protein
VPEAIGNGMALFFVWLFAIAALHKLHAQDYYLRLMSSYTSTSSGSRFLLLLVALGELSLALLLLVPATQATAFAGAAALLSAYAVMMAWQYTRGRGDMQCGCAGPDSTLTVGPPLIVRNLACACLATLAMTSSGALPGSLASGALALVVAVFMIFAYLCSDQMIANAQAMAGDI